MFKLPQFTVFGILAFNLTMFSLMLQFDYLIFHSIWLKILSWIATVALWVLAWVRRKKFFTLF